MSAHPNTSAREFAMQFLYQCELEKLYYFSESHFTAFAQHQSVPTEQITMCRTITRGTLEDLHSIDEQIQTASTSWKLSRMPVVDRSVLRLATFELGLGIEPMRVILNEAVELAKKYGTEDSGRFVNGLLDKIAHGKPRKHSSPD